MLKHHRIIAAKLIVASSFLSTFGCKGPDSSEPSTKTARDRRGSQTNDVKKTDQQTNAQIRELIGSVSIENIQLFDAQQKKVSTISLSRSQTTDRDQDFYMGICASQPLQFKTTDAGARVFDSKGQSVQQMGGSSFGLGKEFEGNTRCSGRHYSLIDLQPGDYKIVGYVIDTVKCEALSKTICGGTFIKKFSDFIPEATSTKVWDLKVEP